MTDTIEALKLENQRLKNENNLLTGWISLISHDTKQIFGSLQWIIEAYESNMINKDDFFNMLPQIKKDAKKSLQTAIDTSDWLKTQFGNFKPKQDVLNAFDLYEQLKQEFDNKLLKKELSFEFKGDAELSIISDKVLLMFILRKIVDNAIKYSNPGKNINFTISKEGNEILLSIVDFGTGIVGNHLKSIYSFENPVFQGTAGEIGAGLGLKIVQSFVFLVDGSIEIDSLENEGTKVNIRLPQIDK